MDIVNMYNLGSSIPDISKATGITKSTVRAKLLKFGVVLRTRTEGIRLKKDYFSAFHRSRKRKPFTLEHRQALSRAKLAAPCAGVSFKSSGYVEYTNGPNKGRCVHVVLMEQKIGRKLHKNEVVHHIDRNRSNNALDNLQLLTRSEHTSLHRREGW